MIDHERTTYHATCIDPTLTPAGGRFKELTTYDLDEANAWMFEHDIAGCIDMKLKTTHFKQESWEPGEV